MPCLCTANTLRLFIRGLARIDVPVAAFSPSSKHIYNGSRRELTPIRTIREFRSTPTQESPRASRRSIQIPRLRQGFNQDEDDSAVLELSSESIDAIAAEFPKNYQVTSSEGLFSEPSHRHTSSGDSLSRTTIRRTKVQNTSLAIHYDNPRTPDTGFSRNRRDDKLPTKPSNKNEWIPPPREPWQIHKAVLKEKFPEGWNPRKRLSPDALAGIRALHAQDPAQYTLDSLAGSFGVSSEDIRRILKSKWSPDAKEESDRQRRWFNRGKQIYLKHAEMGQKPPKRWRDLGIGQGKPEWMLRKQQEATRAPPPALITTAKRPPRSYGGKASSESLEDSLL
jgi:hypothetical protein